MSYSEGSNYNYAKIATSSNIAGAYTSPAKEDSQYPFLEDNLNTLSKNVGYYIELIDRLESIGHKLHDTNISKENMETQRPLAGVGKLFQMQGFNEQFSVLNSKFEDVLQKLNSLI